MKQSLIILTATKAEAGGLINYFKLQKSAKRSNTYCSKTIALVVTGIGENVAFEAAKQVLSENIMIKALVNIGIGGAKDLDVGTLVWPRLIGEVEVNAELPDEQTSPMQVCSFRAPATPIKGAMIYDMEAQGICKALTANASHVQLFCAKVISDNKRYSHTQINAQQATDLIRRHLVEFERLFEIILRD